MKWILRFLVLLFTQQAVAQDSDFRVYYAKSMEAYKKKSYNEFYKLIKEANSLHPYHQGILYQLGVAAALTNHRAEAIDNLKKAILIDTRFKIEGLSDFNGIKTAPDYSKLIQLQNEWSQTVIHSDTALVLRDRTIHCEGIEYNTATATWYAGSIHQRKIVKVSAGVVSDFCPAGFEGMTSIFGLRIDAKTNTLWACASPTPEMESYDSTTRSAVFKFDLSTGKLLAKFIRPSWEKENTFGDLTISPKGDVLVSDSRSNTIFIVNEKTSLLEPWFSSPEIWSLQGVTYGDNDKYLFISDYVRGIYRLNTETKSIINLPTTLDVSMKGIDGLSYYHNSLIAIQNGVFPLRTLRYYLNSSQDKITSFEIIDRGHPAFNEPTLGVVHGDTFYYVANSQWEGYDAKHNIKPADKLQDIVILKSKLSRK